MARWHVQPTTLDREVARIIARHAKPPVEHATSTVTVAADDRLLLAAAAGLWLLSRLGNGHQRRQADYLALNVVVTAAVPRILKHFIAQQRPDRTMVHGRRHGIPRSGKADDAFPSGHAMHVGALSAAVARLWPRSAPIAWAAASLLAATRVVVLAHWVSDVVAGFMLGVGVEHILDAGHVLKPPAGERD
ncbi:phosphatase PAP2 family protein [Vineibacter terrae]|uniref:Phosphatase PAP2 family protein n=1 Tax=Vineibacter terrae TaxID=2586908 RepID=A0A5C8PQV5_9HYPH|nr:phosphatase PAP2 family protein [Vineibacter terrae]TXL77573.1 phosphatase PAP2 family protein [Vineibacter terrae]